ncbi:MAG: YggS family pyridoxal phosphate-dependent enzyme [Bacteroidota bacterium]|jgi:hypothetical protein
MEVKTDIQSAIVSIKSKLPEGVSLVAVSKTKPAELIQAAYNAGQKEFGENYVQELLEKQAQLPEDIKWHFIGHLQSNKVKHIAPFVYLIHGVDSLSLLKEINKQGQKLNKIINCLLQVHIAEEESKFGFDVDEINTFFYSKSAINYPFVKVVGLMGMATNTNNLKQIEKEFKLLSQLFEALKPANNLTVLSMGMSSDYQLAINCGSNLIRIGSAIFGNRVYQK